MSGVRVYEEDREKKRQHSGDSVPKDRCFFVYLVFFLLGVCSVLPWSFFGTARQYFLFKLRNVSISGIESYTNASLYTSAQIRFQSNLEIASQIPNVLLVFVNMILTKTVSTRVRLVSSICINIVLFIPTICFTKIDSDNWQYSFLIVVFTSAVLMNAASAVHQGAISGLASMFPQLYMQSMFGGMGFSIVVASLCSIVTVALGPDVRDSALAFFLIAEFLLTACLILYLLAFSTPFAKFYTKDGSGHLVLSTLHADDNSENAVKPPESSRIQFFNTCKTIVNVARKIWIAAFSILFVYLVSLACLPTVATIQSTSDNDVWRKKYFTPVVCFLVWSLSDFSGRIVAGVIKRPRDTSPIFFIACLLRGLFIPLFLFCNVQPRPHQTYVAFSHDAIPTVLIFLCSFCGGYMGTLSMMHAPRLVSEHDSEIAGSMMACFLSLGLASGAALSSALVNIM